MLHQTGGYKYCAIKGAIGLYSIYSVAMVTKWLVLNRKLAVARLCEKIGYVPESCTTTKHCFQGNFMSETFGTITTLLAMW